MCHFSRGGKHEEFESSRNTSSCLIRGPDGKSAPVFSYGVVSLPFSLWPAEATAKQTQHCVRRSSPNELFISPHPISFGKESWHFAQSTASYWKSAVFRGPDCIQILAVVALLTSIMISQGCAGQKTKKSFLWSSAYQLKCSMCKMSSKNLDFITLICALVWFILIG